MGGEDPWEVVRSKTHEAGGRTDYFANGESVFYSAYGATQFYDATGTPTAFYPASGALRPTVAPYEFLIGSGFSIIGGGIVGVYGLRYYVGNFARLHPRVASDIYGGARVNAGKRGAAFMRKDIARLGSIRVVDWRTLSFNYTTSSGQTFSIGYNIWTRRIFHLSPGGR